MTVKYNALSNREISDIIHQVSEHLLGCALEFNIDMMRDSGDETNFKEIKQLAEDSKVTVEEVFFNDLFEDMKEEVLDLIKKSRINVRQVYFDEEGFRGADIDFEI